MCVVCVQYVGVVLCEWCYVSVCVCVCVCVRACVRACASGVCVLCVYNIEWCADVICA